MQHGFLMPRKVSTGFYTGKHIYVPRATHKYAPGMYPRRVRYILSRFRL